MDMHLRGNKSFLLDLWLVIEFLKGFPGIVVYFPLQINVMIYHETCSLVRLNFFHQLSEKRIRDVTVTYIHDYIISSIWVKFEIYIEISKCLDQIIIILYKLLCMHVCLCV